MVTREHTIALLDYFYLQFWYKTFKYAYHVLKLYLQEFIIH